MRFLFYSFTLLVLLFSAVFSTVLAQNASTYDGYIARRYFELELQLIKTGTGFTPPVASRAIGYTGLALYESVVPGMPSYQSGDGIINGLGPNAIADPGTGPFHWPTSANNALGTIVDSLFGNANATNKLLIRNLKDSFNLAFQAQVAAVTYNNSVAFGQSIAADVYAHSATDGGHMGYASNFPASYVPPVGDGLWVPTPPANLPVPLQPYWGNNRPFILDNVTGDCFLGPHMPYDTTVGSAFYLAAEEVYNTVNNLTQEQKNIADFWADGGGTVTPPGHSISMLSQILAIESPNLEVATLAYSKLAMSQMDAFINCWKIKYAYNLMRPITYIRSKFNPTWNAYIGTPPFPEYTSGHSSQSGAFEKVMTGLFGPSYTFTDNTNGASYGGPRTFTGFSAPAAEAAMSRLYGGIHYTFSNELGVEVGNKIGQNVNKLFATQLQKNPTADVAVQSTFSASSGSIGQTVTVTVSLVNQGLTALSGLQIKNLLPAQLQFLSATAEDGTYNNGTGIWTIPNVAAGVPVVNLTIQAKIIGDGVPYNLAELIAMNESDADSDPNNQLLTEDDMGSACMSVPILMCNPDLTLSAPAGYTSYQWYKSTDNGATFLPLATTKDIIVNYAAVYTFTVDGGILGTCGNQLCCPLIVENQCCPINICLPVNIVRN